MSFQTGTNCELLYSNTVPGAAKATFTSEAQINDAASMGTQPVIPGFFFPANASGAGKTVRIVARGTLSTVSSTAVLWGVIFRLNTAINVITGPIALGSGLTLANGMASSATTAALTNAVWEAQGDFYLVAPKEPTGTNSTIAGLGTITGGAFLQAGSLYAGGAPSASATTTIDIGQPYYVSVSAVCGTSNASNSITLQQLFVYGLN